MNQSSRTRCLSVQYLPMLGHHSANQWQSLYATLMTHTSVHRQEFANLGATFDLPCSKRAFSRDPGAVHGYVAGKLCVATWRCARDRPSEESQALRRLRRRGGG